MQEQNQNQNQNNSPTLSPIAKITDSIVNLINTISQSFQLSKRELLLQKQWLRNIETAKNLQESQETIDLANHKMPILLSSKLRLIILESILVARARDGQPINDVLTAIQEIRKNILETNIHVEQRLINKNSTEKQDNQGTAIKYNHQYDIPILSEIGDLINDARNFIFLTLLVVAISPLFLSFTNPRICNSKENHNVTYTNKSLYCQLLSQVNRFFEDYQKVD